MLWYCNNNECLFYNIWTFPDLSITRDANPVISEQPLDVIRTSDHVTIVIIGIYFLICGKRWVTTCDNVIWDMCAQQKSDRSRSVHRGWDTLIFVAATQARKSVCFYYVWGPNFSSKMFQIF